MFFTCLNQAFQLLHFLFKVSREFHVLLVSPGGRKLLHLLRQFTGCIRQKAGKPLKLHREIAKLFRVNDRLCHVVLDLDSGGGEILFV